MSSRLAEGLTALGHAAVVAVLGVGSGTLECGGANVTAKEAQGERLYGRMCAVCHGPSGQGYAADRAPSLTSAEFLATVDDSYLKTAILEGRAGTTMSAWSSVRGGPLIRQDVEAIVAYLRSFYDGRQAVLDNGPVTGDAGRGDDLFAARCASCHGPHGLDGAFVGVGNPELLRSASSGFLRAVIRGGRAGTPMPGFIDSLGGQGVDDVLAVLRIWQREPGPQRQPAPRPPPLPLGPVPLHPHGPEPEGFHAQPETTKVDVVKQQLDRGARMALLDARAQSDYLQEHIADAVSVPFFDPDPYVAQLPRDAWLVCYCSCPHAESKTLASKLVDKGFAKVTVLDEGLRVWKSRGYPTRVGMEP